MYVSELLQWAAEYANELSWGKAAPVASAWCPGKFIHLWVDVPADDVELYECTVELSCDLLAGMFGSTNHREIDHGGGLRETVFEPVSEFSVTVQMKHEPNVSGD